MLAIIGGSGFYTLGEDFELDEQVGRDTPYGNTSSDILIGDWFRQRVAFLPRHGPGHRIPPQRINYRANLWALQAQGVDRIVAVNAVGGIAEHLPPGSLAVPDQLIDYSCGRECTFFDGGDGEVRHIDFSRPYSETLRASILAAARDCGQALIDGGTYACTNGPRLETAAEIRRLRNDGCDLVGMTGMPEAALARELEIEYACLALVVNWAAGVEDRPIEMDEILANMALALEHARPLLRAVLAREQR